MQGMFDHLYKLEYLEIYFNTSLVTNMNYMFKECYKLTSLDVSNFDTSSVEVMESMFYGCQNLVSINVTNFNLFI